jgi:hypothetical protein
MERWTAEQRARAEASGFLARLPLDAWPLAVRDAEGDATDGTCELRYLYAQFALPAPPPAPSEQPAPAVDDFEACETWQDEDGTWRTNFPPPPGFEGEEEGDPLDPAYERALTDEEQARLPARAFSDCDEEVPEAPGTQNSAEAAELADLHAARRRYFNIAEEEEQGSAGVVAVGECGTTPPMLPCATGFAGLEPPCTAFMAGPAATPLAEKAPGK